MGFYYTSKKKLEMREAMEKLGTCNKKRTILVNPMSLRDIKINRNGFTKFRGYELLYDGKNQLKIYSHEHGLMKTIFGVDRGTVIRLDFHLEYRGEDIFPKVKFIDTENHMPNLMAPAIEVLMPAITTEVIDM